MSLYNLRDTLPIHNISKLVCPERTLRNVEQLESGKSFNNRIYFLSYEEESPYDKSTTQADIFNVDHVLKVSGQFWGLEKVQNEVSCLLLLERYCPGVPAPRVFAYSEDGNVIRVIVRGRSGGLPEATRDHIRSAILESQPHPWILLTRCPGQRLEAADLHTDSGEHILKQIARYVAQWRHQIPRVYQIGNVQTSDSSSVKAEDVFATFQGIKPLRISGLLQCEYKPPHTISTSLQYYHIQLHEQLQKLQMNPNFAPNCEKLVSPVRNFIDHTLPNLYLFCGVPQQAIFTHNDLSPRNILVSKNGIITGILDFEFAGFFPVEEDFTNMMIHNRDDWPESTDAVLFTELERLNVDTPLHGFDERAWEEAKVLVDMIANIAPWHLAEGGKQGDELAGDLCEAARLAKNGIELLKRSTTKI